MPADITIYVGTEPRTELARKVLEHSVLKRTELSVAFVPMLGPEWEYDHEGIPVGTNFSLRRWMIPQHHNWDGLVIYLDADQIVLGDIAHLWFIPSCTPAPSDTSAWCTFQFHSPHEPAAFQSSVMIINCAAAKKSWCWRIEEVLQYLKEYRTRGAYHGFQRCECLCPPPRTLPSSWNRLHTFVPGKTQLLHYTSVPNQPWISPQHPLASFWQGELESALRTGYLSREDLSDALSGWGELDRHGAPQGVHPFYRRYLSRSALR